MQAKTERFEMRLDQGTIDRVDRWRAEQDNLPSRAEAVRRLMEAGLRASDNPGISFSAGEKLTLIMLCDMYKHLNISGEIDPKFVSSAIFGGHNWGLSWEYSGLFHDHVDSDAVVSEVVDVLDMWLFIESGYASLSETDKQHIAVEAEPLGKHVVFSGFDGNNESEHFSVARFMIDDLKRFTTFQGRDLNSHAPLMDAYRRMLTVFEPMRRTLIGIELSASQIIELLKARMHPDRARP